MDSTQTLHDFVLNLLTNSEARSAFQLDPEGALHEAGLGDITAADVQDVVPLVVDYASVQGDAGLAPVGGDLNLGALGTDPTSVIGQLQAVTQLSIGGTPTTIDGGVAAAGVIAADSSAFGLSLGGFTGVGASAGPSGVSADLSGTQDVAGTLDSDVVDSVTSEATGTVDGALGTADGLVAGTPANGLLDGLPTDGLLDGLPTDGLLDGLPTDGLLDGDPLDGVLGTANSTVGGVTSQVGDPTGLVGGSGTGPVDVPDLGVDTGTPLNDVTGAADDVLDGVGGLLDGVGGNASADGDLLGATDILF